MVPVRVGFTAGLLPNSLERGPFAYDEVAVELVSDRFETDL
jgi:hypothetical protein